MFEFLAPEPVGPADAPPVETEAVAKESRSWRDYEELMWWAVCFVAVAIILWRQLA